jgi:hypothetical protein
MKYKILEKKMTINDALKYVSNHKKWRLPSFDEAIEISKDEYNVRGVLLFTSKSQSIENRVIVCDVSNKFEVEISDLFKLKILLIETDEWKDARKNAEHIISSNKLNDDEVKTIKFLIGD